MVNDFVSYKCPRVIRQSKYERQSPETFNWWLRLFQIMETEFLIPPYKRKEVVREIFPNRIFKKILSLLTLIEGDLSEPIRPISATTLQSAKSGTDTAAKTAVETEGSLRSKSATKQQKKREAGPNNPYLRFFKRKPERAAIWRDLPPLSPDEMNLNQKAEAITEMISVDFINWIQNLGGETNTMLDVEQVMKMFEVGFNTHAATSLEAKVKEMPAVPKAVADARGLPEKTIHATLLGKMQEDIKAFGRKPKLLAFGKTLPNDLRVVPPKVNPTKRWIKARSDESLKSMATVWEGITELRSTRAYCKWLIAHPEIPQPKYLQKLGMLESSFFDQPHYSIETQDSGDQSYTVPSVGPGMITQRDSKQKT